MAYLQLAYTQDMWASNQRTGAMMKSMEMKEHQ